MSIATIDRRPRRAVCFTPMETDRSVLVDAAVRAERLGYEAIVVPEGWALDTAVVLTEIAIRTERIRLVAGVQSIWGRTPATLAMEAATLDEVSGGRFVLGIGASTATLSSRFHGVPFRGPAARLAATLAAVRSLLDGERAVAHDGSPGLRLGLQPRRRIPIWVAALGPRAVDIAIHGADGWFPAFATAADIEHATKRAAPGAVCELVMGPVVAVSDRSELATHAVRQLIGWYLTGMGPLYGDHLVAQGHGDAVGALRMDNPRPRPGCIVWPDAADPLLDELGVHGHADEVATAMRSWDGRVDVVTVTTGPATPADLNLLLEACAPPPAAPLSAGVASTIRTPRTDDADL